MTGEGYSVSPGMVKEIGTEFDSLLSSGSSILGELGSAQLSASAFAVIGAPVAGANSSLDLNLLNGMSRLLQVLENTNQNVCTAADNYATADNEIAQAYGGNATATPTAAQTSALATKMGPGNEPPLPAYNVKKPTAKDYALKFELGTDGLAYLGPVKGWWNAEKLFQHYLYGNGEDYQVDPSQLMHDVPSFQQAVDDYVNSQQGKGSFDSGWINTNTDIRDANGNVVGQQSLDWYYGLHDWRYRITGTSTMVDGVLPQNNYTVEVYKPYVFGSPRSDINIPIVTDLSKQFPSLTNGPIRLPQDAIQNLNATGLARNFYVTGSSSFSYP